MQKSGHKKVLKWNKSTPNVGTLPPDTQTPGHVDTWTRGKSNLKIRKGHETDPNGTPEALDARMWRIIFWRSRKSAPEHPETEKSRSKTKFSILNATKRAQTAPQRLSTRASCAESFGDAENQHQSAQKPKSPGQKSIFRLLNEPFPHHFLEKQKKHEFWS